MNPTTKKETTNQTRFFELLSEFRPLQQFWAREKLECDPDAVEMYLSVASQGEATALKCLVSIWSGTSQDGYLAVSVSDLACLSDAWRDALVGWIQDPFWP